ncbi:hypothetical protein J3Q64DRAFT_1739139 [Phycomyces blakesleeanus]|uniref:PH domain-containing protein n=2 Tax=Phycomyces blakesleeanus TaxID=4837 RepID=A0A167NBC6_PHYB8|nr:hypothetical protein PHYBLDRAFT_180831 [Phycomyces blakesleeanus NRRL 1555(-)]OAD75584.1 hypothetical protein PHYBLDRAFT_180831 [Phycomyces blakesleeanus NRRL 1555(-)]|eukprot:XP_018293624.1 hypothetical protein PHYBLDRAFT_180831 [Phycomyces blakesleeanus NRRL 1555(-)]
MPTRDLEYPQGWLFRWTRNKLKSVWQKRYYVLSETELRYYKDQQGCELAGIIELRFYKSAQAYTTKKAPYSFQITSRCTERKSYIISAENEQDRQFWIALIDAAIRDLESKTMQRFDRRETQVDEEQDYSNSVLDKWLDRLDLNDHNHSQSRIDSSLLSPKYAPSLISHDCDSIIDKYASIPPALRSCQSIESLNTNGSSLRSEPTTLSSGSTRSLLQPSSYCSALSASSPGKGKGPEVVVTSSHSTPPLGSSLHLTTSTPSPSSFDATTSPSTRTRTSNPNPNYLWQPQPRNSSLSSTKTKDLKKAFSSTRSVS